MSLRMREDGDADPEGTAEMNYPDLFAAPDDSYGALRDVLDEAFVQAAEGKGKERHANGRSFRHQPIMEIGRIVGPGFAAGQVMKKAGEAVGMASRGERSAAERELLGAIVYAASAVLLLREQE